MYEKLFLLKDCFEVYMFWPNDWRYWVLPFEGYSAIISEVAIKPNLDGELLRLEVGLTFNDDFFIGYFELAY